MVQNHKCCTADNTVIIIIIINPQRACAQRGLRSCPVCIMCVCPLITAASHVGITKEIYQRIHSNTGIVLNVANFSKNATFKSYGVICLPPAAPAS